MTGVFEAPADVVCRRNVRHHLIRARNNRIAETRDSSWPVLLTAHPATLDELLTDGDPAEAFTVDAFNNTIAGVPYQADARLQLGVFELVWP